MTLLLTATAIVLLKEMTFGEHIFTLVHTCMCTCTHACTHARAHGHTHTQLARKKNAKVMEDIKNLRS